MGRSSKFETVLIPPSIDHVKVRPGGDFEKTDEQLGGDFGKETPHPPPYLLNVACHGSLPIKGEIHSRWTKRIVATGTTSRYVTHETINPLSPEPDVYAVRAASSNSCSWIVTDHC